MLYTIYKTTNTNNGKFYIGMHKTENPDDAYLGSGKLLKFAIQKHGKDAFEKHVLYVFQTEGKMIAKEEELVDAQFILREDTYNVKLGGDRGPLLEGKKNGMYGKTHTACVRKALGENTKKRLSGRTYEEIYGASRAADLKAQRSAAAKKARKYYPNTASDNPNAKKYQFIDPDGQKHKVHGKLKEFCNAHKLDIGSVINVAKGRIPTYKSWHISYLI